MNAPPVIDNCPNCGSPLDSTNAYCARCGWRSPAEKDHRRREVNFTLSIIFFIVFGLPAAACGGCFLLLSNGFGTARPDATAITIGMAGILVFLALLIWLIKTASDRRK